MIGGYYQSVSTPSFGHGRKYLSLQSGNYLTVPSFVAASVFTIAYRFKRVDTTNDIQFAYAANVAPKMGFTGTDFFFRGFNNATALRKNIGYTSALNNTWCELLVTRDSSNQVYASLNRQPYVLVGTQSGDLQFRYLGWDLENGNQTVGALDEVKLLTSFTPESEMVRVLDYSTQFRNDCYLYLSFERGIQDSSRNKLAVTNAGAQVLDY